MCFGYIRIAVVNHSVKKPRQRLLPHSKLTFLKRKMGINPKRNLDSHYDLTLRAIDAGAKVIVGPETTIISSLEDRYIIID